MWACNTSVPLFFGNATRCRKASVLSTYNLVENYYALVWFDASRRAESNHTRTSRIQYFWTKSQRYIGLFPFFRYFSTPSPYPFQQGSSTLASFCYYMSFFQIRSVREEAEKKLCQIKAKLWVLPKRLDNDDIVSLIFFNKALREIEVLCT